MTERRGGAAGFLHTAVVTREQIDGWSPGLPYAALFQERLFARAELRATVIGGRVIVARIDRTEDHATDWRQLLGSSAASVAAGAIDDALEQQLVAVVRDLGLVYGSVDLVEAVDGSTYFLEVNPSGSYLWVEVLTGMDLTGALVDELLGGSL